MSEANYENVLNTFDVHLLTSIYSKEFSVKWTLKGFSQLANEVEYESPLLEPAPACQCRLLLKKKTENLCFYLENKSQKKISLRTAISIFDSDGKHWHCNSKTKDFAPNEKTDIIDSISRFYQELLRLKEDTLIIICNLKITTKVTTKCPSPILSMPQSYTSINKYNGQMKLCEDLKNFYNDKQHADIILKVDGVNVPANKAILCARSAVFEKMFCHSMNEEQNGNVQIDDVPLPVLKRLVEFMYTGEIDIENDFAAVSALYYAADKYQVLDLRKMCADTLLSLMKVDNVTVILMTANRHEDDYLKNKALYFFSNNANSVFKSETWKEFVSKEAKLAAQTLELSVKTITNVK